MTTSTVLLINVPILEKKPSRVAEHLGLLYLKSSLVKSGYNVLLLDFDVIKYNEKHLINVFEVSKPILIGVSLSTASYKTAKNWINKWRKLTKAPIVIGGHHPTGDPIGTLKELQPDFIYRGEGEIAIVRLSDKIKNKETDFTDIPGLIAISDYLNNDKINTGIYLNKQLDELQFPSRQVNRHDIFKNMLTVIGSRGCPHKCIFCYNSNPELNRSFRVRSIGNIINEIKTNLKLNPTVETIFFLDDCFSVNRNRAFELSEELGKLKKKWIIQCRIDEIDEELIKKFSYNGCYSIYFGIESVYADLGHSDNKSKDRNKIREIIKICQKYGILVRGNILIGFADDTEKTIYENGRFASTLNLNRIELSYVVPYPGSHLLRMVTMNDFKVDWNHFIFSKPVVLSKNLSEFKLTKAYVYIKLLYLFSVLFKNPKRYAKPTKEYLSFWTSIFTFKFNISIFDFLKLHFKAIRDLSTKMK